MAVEFPECQRRQHSPLLHANRSRPLNIIMDAGLSDTALLQEAASFQQQLVRVLSYTPLRIPVTVMRTALETSKVANKHASRD